MVESIPKRKILAERNFLAHTHGFCLRDNLGLAGAIYNIFENTFRIMGAGQETFVPQWTKMLYNLGIISDRKIFSKGLKIQLFIFIFAIH